MEHLEASSPYGEMVLSYGCGFTQHIADQTARLNARDIQLLEVKEMNDLQAEYRAQLRAMINEYRQKKSEQGPASKQHYISFECVLMRRRITDFWKIYRMVVADSHDMMGMYLQNLKNNSLYQTSHPTEKTARAIA